MMGLLTFCPDILPMQFYPDATGLLGTTEPLKPRDGTDNIYDLGTVTRGLPGTKLFLCWSGELAGELTPIGFVQLAGPHDDQDTLGPAHDQRLSYLCLQLSHFELFARTCIWNYLDI